MPAPYLVGRRAAERGHAAASAAERGRAGRGLDHRHVTATRPAVHAAVAMLVAKLRLSLPERPGRPRRPRRWAGWHSRNVSGLAGPPTGPVDAYLRTSGPWPCLGGSLAVSVARRRATSRPGRPGRPGRLPGGSSPSITAGAASQCLALGAFRLPGGMGSTPRATAPRHANATPCATAAPLRPGSDATARGPMGCLPPGLLLLLLPLLCAG